MPVPYLNNISTLDIYTDALTVNFDTGKPHFTLLVYNASIYYTLIAFRPPNNYHDVSGEHHLVPVLANFDDPLGEGLGEGELFGGIKLRSAVVGTPARVTVI